MSDEDCKVALDYLRILKPFKQATLDLCGQKKIESGKLYLVMHLIDAHIKDVNKNYKNKYSEAIQSMQMKFDKYWPIVKSYSLLAHVLDPRYKYENISNISKRDASNSIKTKQEQIASELNINQNPNNVDNDELSEFTKANTSLIEQMMSDNSQLGCVNGEINKFFQSPRLDKSIDSLIWWKNNYKLFPILSKIALEYIAFQPTSTSSERSFSISNLNITQIRSRLSQETVKMLMSLYSWNRKTVQ